MKKFIIGVVTGIFLMACFAWISNFMGISLIKGKEIVLPSNQHNQLENKLKDLTQIIEKKEDEHKTQKESLDQIKKDLNSYAKVVSTVVQGEVFPFEIISDTSEETIVFSPNYIREVPENTDLQKLYLIRLTNELAAVKGAKITFWSNKDDALLYSTGDKETNGTEGWVGQNSKFGTMLKVGDSVYLWHHLGVHEKDSVTFGIYQIKE
ncbi:hypothetical protein [Brevibacillus choshinensis]|uniref:Uncharacterized protein n=1 Tax=Brevibacillus choshinensis TaxID=54911 RepID=A0ABX7FKL5_BRECH|nr:hypothetical protein [Brevibacillus choshinensis]QRG66677.1 hypothetical protein JNE38_24720 [Brevibacillus choshinensis]